MFKHEVIVGSQNNTDMTSFPLMMNNLFGTKFRVIGVYASGTRVNLALVLGEVQGRCGWSWASVKATGGHWIKGGQVSWSRWRSTSTRSCPTCPSSPTSSPTSATGRR